MPTITATITPDTHFAHVAVWPAMANGDTGSPYQTAEYPDKTIQVEGTLGVGGEVSIEGSLDGENYHVLTDFSGASLVITALSLKGVTENVLYLRPRISGGDGDTALTVTLLARRDQ